ncbi:S1 family peptidase [Flexithrix dorotheae]|uniref:S1 family peptidase n=1 Tax=Flexithrix dorotheae TaxID=70993 RepID=UPI00037B2C56|nr:serine protease [Flexithrix dorotheae]
MPPLKVEINPLSYCSIPITMVFSETMITLANGTGFIFEKKSKYYLITNWHNLTGRNPDTKEFLSSHGGIPDRINLKLLCRTKPHILWKDFSFSLYDENNNPLWFIHPEHCEKVDVIALELKFSNDSQAILKPLNKICFDEYKLEIADDIYILGFPYSIKGGGNFPIWKRGSIATEPDLFIDKLPKILVDTASRPGMSGSPVIFRRTGIHGFENGFPTEGAEIGLIQGFVGVYSGRLVTNNNFDAQLGIIWKARVIEEIINGNQLDKKIVP